MRNKIHRKIALIGVLSYAVMGFAFAPIAGAAETEVTCKCGLANQVMSLECGAICTKAKDQRDSLFGSDGIFVTITNTALFLIGAVSVVMLIYGGIRYTVSGGESGAVTNAKNTILYAIVGIVVAILAYAAVQFVIGQLVK